MLQEWMRQRGFAGRGWCAGNHRTPGIPKSWSHRLAMPFVPTAGGLLRGADRVSAWSLRADADHELEGQSPGSA